ncbi:hypothetical protein V1478_000531 [Vespula squamosa]|uniref:Uncharacterized protein n=1 Tax=Vespula squamosa TaxID=30214 RepID=A0ABD2C5V5_VESSQ
MTQSIVVIATYTRMYTRKPVHLRRQQYDSPLRNKDNVDSTAILLAFPTFPSINPESSRMRYKDLTRLKALTYNLYKRLQDSRDNGISEGSYSTATAAAAAAAAAAGITAAASRAAASEAIAIAIAAIAAEAVAVASSAVAALKNPGKKILRACAKFGRPAAGPRRTASYGGPHKAHEQWPRLPCTKF